MWPFRKELRYAVRSNRWPALRKQHIEKQPCCMACGSCKKPEVHHIVPVHLNPDLELDPENLITLCDKYCHFIFGHLMDYKSWNVDVVDDSAEYLQKIQNKPRK
jgi:5-methylcytosine-specific restriction endonuclease McrA